MHCRCLARCCEAMARPQSEKCRMRLFAKMATSISTSPDAYLSNVTATVLACQLQGPRDACKSFYGASDANVGFARRMLAHRVLLMLWSGLRRLCPQLNSPARISIVSTIKTVHRRRWGAVVAMPQKVLWEFGISQLHNTGPAICLTLVRQNGAEA